MTLRATDRQKNISLYSDIRSAINLLEERREEFTLPADEFNQYSDPSDRCLLITENFSMLNSGLAVAKGFEILGETADIEAGAADDIRECTIDEKLTYRRPAKWVMSTRSSHEPISSWLSTNHQIAQSLGRLQDGWMGEESRCPSESSINTILIIGNVLPSKTREPICEVDEDTGDVTYRWLSLVEQASFALIFKGDGSIVGVHVTAERTYPTRKFSSNESRKVANMAEDPMINKLLTE